MYSEEVAALRARGLLQAGQFAEAQDVAESVTYESAPMAAKHAPWRTWVVLQVRTRLCVCVCAHPVPLPFTTSRVWGAYVAVSMHARVRP